MPQLFKQSRAIYLPERLQTKLERIDRYPLTVVSAPIACGKTAAVRQYLSRCATDTSLTILWQTMFGDGSSGFWSDFIAAFEGVDSVFHIALQQISLPVDSGSQRDFFRQFQKYCQRLEATVMLVLDNVQTDSCPDVLDFLHFFARSIPENFHLLLLERSQSLKNDDFFRIYGLANGISQEDFEFSPKDIERYFRISGVPLAPPQARRLHSLSSGWVAVVQMNLLEYAEHGAFLPESELFELLRRTLLAPLPERQREFLAVISVVAHFTAEQAAYLWGQEDAEFLLDTLASEGLYIRRDRTDGCYRFSPAFAAYYAERNRHLSEEVLFPRLNKLAEWYLKNDDNAYARRLYHRVRNFDALMDAVEKRRFLVLYGLDEREFISYYTDCPPEIRARHPRAILTFARQMFALGFHEMGKEVCAEFERIMGATQTFDEEKRSQLTGTYELLLCYAQYNDLSQMLEHIHRAKQLLDDRRAAIPWPDTGLNDSLSLLYMYHRQPGSLQKEVAQFAEYNPLYSAMIGGRLDGAELVMQAEALYVTGDLQGAEIVLHKALLAVHRDKQWHTWLCTVMLQMRVALMQGNWRAIEHLLGEAQESVLLKQENRIVPATDILQIFLYSKLEQPRQIHAEFDVRLTDSSTLCFRAAPMLYCIQAEALLAKGETVQLLALSERYLQAARVYPNVYAEQVLLIEIAGAYESLGKKEKAVEQLKSALQLARPDRILIPFVELGHYVRETLPMMAQTEFSGEVEEILRLGKSYAQGLKKIISEHFTETPGGLTGREMEIAKLAALRLSNKEIADRLIISESTVKTQLARAFSKLDICKRRDLNRFFPEK